MTGQRGQNIWFVRSRLLITVGIVPHYSGLASSYQSTEVSFKHTDLFHSYLVII